MANRRQETTGQDTMGATLDHGKPQRPTKGYGTPQRPIKDHRRQQGSAADHRRPRSQYTPQGAIQDHRKPEWPIKRLQDTRRSYDRPRVNTRTHKRLLSTARPTKDHRRHTTPYATQRPAKNKARPLELIVIFRESQKNTKDAGTQDTRDDVW